MFKVYNNQMSVSHLAEHKDSPAHSSYVRSSLARALAEDIMMANIQKEKFEYYTAYSMQVIVATKEDFFKAVAEYSMKTSGGYPMPLEYLYDERRT